MRPPKVWSRRRRRTALGLAAALGAGAFALAATAPSTTPLAADGTTSSVAAVAPVQAIDPGSSSTIVEVQAVVPAAAQAATVAAPVPTGSAQGCDELHVLVDTDGDSWGECVPDLDGAHARAQAMVKFLGYSELTCVTDPVTAASTCEVTTVDDAVRTLVVEMTGVVSRNDETRPAPTTSAPTTLAPAPIAVAPFASLGSDCDSNYSGCVPIDSDVDCAGGSGNGPSYVSGPVKVLGRDIYGLDKDGDGFGC